MTIPRNLFVSLAFTFLLSAGLPAAALAETGTPAFAPNGTGTTKSGDNLEDMRKMLTEKLSKTEFNIRDYGATGDGRQKDTAAILAAIDACVAKGGGTVRFPPGTYLTATIRLKSNVRLYVEKGAVLLGSSDQSDYPHPGSKYLTRGHGQRGLLHGEALENIVIEGPGTIQGPGKAAAGWGKADQGEDQRPLNIALIQCRNIVVRDLTMTDSAGWMQVYRACENVDISGLTVRNLVNPNNDGIDIDACSNVRVSKCDVDSIDDAICLKAMSPRDTQNITITDCVVSSRCNGLKMGTDSLGGFKDITITNCRVNNTQYIGVALEIVDGGVMDNVTIRDITMDQVATPIFIRLGNRGRHIGPGVSEVGKLQNVTLKNIEARRAGAAFGCPISGVPGHPIENVTLSNIRISFAGGGEATKEWINRTVPENEKGYPQDTMFGPLPAYGFYIRHAKDITLNNIQLDFMRTDFRPALVCDDVTGLTLSECYAKKPSGDGPLTQFVNTSAVKGTVENR